MRATLPAGSSRLAQYEHCAEASSARVIAEYSTSFGMAVRLLAPGYRSHIRNLYGLVRLADEIVDGAAAEAGVDRHSQLLLLDDLERETAAATARGFSTNLVVHSFASTARRAGIGADLTAPFFGSMRRDLGSGAFEAHEVREYIYGSAEVIGLMCLRVFVAGRPADEASTGRLEEGAQRLGAAFQKINFLRDLAADWSGLGRTYFAGVTPDSVTEAQKQALVSDIDADLAAAAAAIPHLPRGARKAVTMAYRLFADVNERLRRTPAHDLAKARVRVPAWRKAAILAGVTIGRAPSGHPQ